VWRIESEKLCGVRSGGRIKFTVAAGTLQGAIEALRGLRCAGDKRRGKTGITRWSTSAWRRDRCFSFRACRFWRISGRWRKVKTRPLKLPTVFAMEEIPSDKLRRARLGRAVPLQCVFDATLAALEQTGVWSRFRRLGSHVLIAFRRHRISAPTSSRYCRFSPLVPIARCLQRWPCEPVARIDLQSRCRPKW
jgi:hypothetical protein